MFKLRAALTATVLAIPMAAGLSGPAQASRIVMTGCTANSQLVEHTVCGATDVGGIAGGSGFVGSTGLGGVGAFFSNGVGGAVSSTGVGVGGVTATASGSGSFGELHLFASANNGQFSEPEFFNHANQGSARAIAEIAFADGGYLPGSPDMDLQVRLSVTLDGSFSGDGQADTTIWLQNGAQTLYAAEPVLMAGGASSFTYTADFDAHGGDIIHFFMDTFVRAGSSNEGFPVLYAATADFSHTGRLYFDILTPGLSFESFSGHDYSSASASPAAPGIPEPTTWAVMLLGFSLIGVALRRCRHSATASCAGRP